MGFAELVVKTLRSSPHVSRCTVGRSMHVDPGHDRSLGDATYQYAAVLEFSSEQGRSAYLNEPAHADLGRAFWATCERTVVCEVRATEVGGISPKELVE